MAIPKGKLEFRILRHEIMENNQPEKSQIIVSKSFLTSGPTLHYSHKNVQRNWLLALCIYGITCLFWSKIATGSFFSFEIEEVATQAFWRLDQSLVTGISIFEYPWQILVLGLLMGILAIIPVLISQLMCFEYSLPCILEIIILANLPGFAICLLISCFAVACRPLRFRSRFISVALCAAPQLAYWIYFGRGRGVEPIEMGFTFVPWFVAWLDSLIMAGFVLGIGHFIRYKPGLIWIFAFITLSIAVIVFESAIGFDELDYQLYIAKNNPEGIDDFQHEYNIAEALKETIRDPVVQKYLRDFYYPTDPNLRWEVLKREIQQSLSYDRWPGWFILPDSMDYMSRKDVLFKEYEKFIKLRTKSPRMSIALYYKAILSEYSPDIRYLGENEILRFYSDYPWERSTETWFILYNEFSDRPESLEARWRIAKQWAGRGNFDQAQNILNEAQTKIIEQLKSPGTEQKTSESLFSRFQIPTETAMTASKLKDLQRRTQLILSLIASENRSEKKGVNERLKQFVMLNSHSLDYPQQINNLLRQTDESDPLRDNLLFAEAKLETEEDIRIQKLGEIHKQYKNTDGGMQAFYELAFMDFTKWRQQDNSNAELKLKYKEEARTALSNFISMYPESFYIEQTKKYLDEIQAN